MKKSIFGLFTVLFVSMFCLGCIEKSSGTRVGELVKFSEKGLFYKSGEGDLVMNTFSMKSQNRVGGSGNVLHFSVANDNPKYRQLCDKFTALNGKHVKIHYVEEMFVSPARADTKYLIVDVEEYKSE